MYAVVVTIQVVAGKMAAFLPLMEENAAASRKEAGCRQFDICTDPQRPNEVFLYELYDDPAAFEAHLASAHFSTFDRASAGLIAEKAAQTYAVVAQ